MSFSVNYPMALSRGNFLGKTKGDICERIGDILRPGQDETTPQKSLDKVDETKTQKVKKS